MSSIIIGLEYFMNSFKVLRYIYIYGELNFELYFFRNHLKSYVTFQIMEIKPNWHYWNPLDQKTYDKMLQDLNKKYE